MKKYIILALLFATTFINAQPFSNMEFFFGGDKDVTAPDIPQTLYVNGLQEKDSLTWAANSESDLLYYYLYRNTSDDSTGSSLIDSIAAGTTVYIDTPLTAETVYFYWLKAGDDKWNTSYFSSVVSDTVKPILYAIDFDGSTEYLSKTTPELKLQGTYSLQETFSDGDYTTGNLWTVSSGSYAVVDSVGYSGLAKSLRCATAGVISIPCNQAYGSWEFDLRKGGGANVAGGSIISPDINTTYNIVGDYRFFFYGNESVVLNKTLVGTSANIIESAASYIVNWVAYRLKITRNTNGSFSAYIKGGAFGTDYVLVSVTGGSGTNPVIDNTYTQSNYFVLDLDAGDMIANIQCEYGSGSMDLNGHEMVKYPYQNSTFEGGDTTYWAGAGTHSIDTSSTYKYAGGYAGKVIATGVGDTTTNYVTLHDSTFTDLVVGEKYTIEVWMNADSTGSSSSSKPIPTMKIGSKQFFGAATDTIPIYPGLWKKYVYNFQATSAEINTPIKFYLSQADTVYVDNFSIRESYDISQWAFVKSSDVGTLKMIAENYTSSKGIKLYLTTANKLEAVIGDGINTVTATGTATTLANGVEHLVGLTASRTGNMQLYLDGVADGSAVSITGLGSIVSTNTFQIGLLSADYFNGQISEIQINRFNDLTTTNYTPSQIYYRSKSGFYFPSAYTGATISAWFTWAGVDASNMLTDKSGSGNTLTATGIDINHRVVITH